MESFVSLLTLYSGKEKSASRWEVTVGQVHQWCRLVFRAWGTRGWEHFQEGTLQTRKRTYLESLSETFRKGTDGKPACDLTGVNSACRQRMIYMSLSSKKESSTFIGNLITYYSRKVRILFLDSCYSHSHINMTVNKIKKFLFSFFFKSFLSPVKVSRTRRQKEPKLRLEYIPRTCTSCITKWFRTGQTLSLPQVRTRQSMYL